MRSLIIISALLIAAPAWAQTDPTAEDTVVVFDGPETVIVETDNNRFEVSAEIARTPDQQTRGLMWRDNLGAGSGMLFVYEPARSTSIWMPNVSFPLDILFIAPSGEVMKVIGHAQPGSRRSLPSDFVVGGVLELPGGSALSRGIRPGAIVRHAIFNNVEPVESEETAQESGSAPD